MSKFRKRSVIVEAEQFKGQECLPFAGRGDPCRYDYPSYEWVVDTLEGPLPISRGDWIIKEPTSGFHVCKADVFEQTYEPVMTGYHDVEEFYKHDPNEKQETHGICAVGEELEGIRKRMESKEAIQGEPQMINHDALRTLANETAGQLTTIGVLAHESTPEYAAKFAPIILSVLQGAMKEKDAEIARLQRELADLAAVNEQLHIEFVAFIRSILDGTDKGTGKLADLRLESLRQDLLALVAKKETRE